MTYLRLDPREIANTVRSLRDRVVERFPESDLGKVANELVSVSEATLARSEEIERPNRTVRALVAVLVVIGVAVAFLFARELRVRNEDPTWSDVIQGAEAGLGGLVLLGAAVVFLVTLEHRMKRRRAIRALFELRSLAHIVDLHQLAKDPSRWHVAAAGDGSVPAHGLGLYDMGRYLDFCGDLLALIAKIGALYVEHLEDPVVLEAADSIEDLTNGLSRKIWQKMEMLDRNLSPSRGGGAAED